MEPASLRPELLRDRVDERGRVVVRPRSISRRARASARTARARIAARPRRESRRPRPTVERGELDLEPVRQLALLRPDSGHGRSRVAGDHAASLELAQAGQPVPRLGTDAPGIESSIRSPSTAQPYRS